MSAAEDTTSAPKPSRGFKIVPVTVPILRREIRFLMQRSQQHFLWDNFSIAFIPSGLTLSREHISIIQAADFTAGARQLRVTACGVEYHDCPFWAVEFYFKKVTRIFFYSIDIFYLEGSNKSANQMIEFCMEISGSILCNCLYVALMKAQQIIKLVALQTSRISSLYWLQDFSQLKVLFSSISSSVRSHTDLSFFSSEGSGVSRGCAAVFSPQHINLQNSRSFL